MAEVRTLANGLRLIVDPMPGLETAAVGVWARAGAIDESAEENGVAHLLEHMAFKGTRRRTARRIAEEIESVGGYLNAETGYQRTGYFARVLRNDVDVAFDILADILTEPLFDEGELEKEKEVVVQEIGEAWDAPDDAANEILQRLAYGDHALGRPILGSLETVRSADAARLKRFMSDRYSPDGLVVAAAGGIDADRLEAIVSSLFGGRAGGGGSQTVRSVPAYGGGAEGDDRDIEQTHIGVAFPGVGARHADYYAMRVFAELFGGGMSSRLFQTIREDRGLAYSVYAYAECFDDVGVLGAYLGTDSENADEAVRLLRRELEAVAKKVEDAELARARSMLKSSVLMGLENPAGRIDAATSQLFTFGRVITAAELCEGVEAVTGDDVRRCALQALEGEPCVSAVGPGGVADLARAVAGA